jgi:hypothetical protein
MEEHEIESNCNIMKFSIFADYYLMREGLPDHVACTDCLGNVATLLVGCVRERDHLRARRKTWKGNICVYIEILYVLCTVNCSVII